VLRDHPEAVRSVLLDSSYPPQVNLYTSLAPSAQRAFDVLFERCAADPGCGAAYPDLKTVLYSLVDQLNASPETVSLLAEGSGYSVRMDGGLLLDMLLVGLYNPSVAAWMPKMIYEIRQNEYAILRERLALYFDTSGALGMQMSVQCSEEVPFNAPEEAFTLARGLQPQMAAFFPDSVQPTFAACWAWKTAPPDPREKLPVTSSLPALILAGEYDPITPPDWGRMVAGNLSRAYFFEFPANGHWVTRSSSCALQIAFAFWNNPDEQPESSCIGQIGGLHFGR
jgi:pimeloyl-ACP methyl ester carboxylesterase